MRYGFDNYIYVNGEAVTFSHQECTSNITTGTAPPAGVIAVPLPEQGPLPEGFVMSEEITFGPVQTPAGVKVVTNYNDLDYKASVSDLPVFFQSPLFRGLPSRKLTPPGVLYAVNRTTAFAFHAPTIPTTTVTPAKPKALFTISALDLTMGTVDLHNTNGSSSYEWIIQSPELGTLFNSRVIVLQGFRPIVTGDIPASAFKLSRGKAVLPEYLTQVEMEVPDGLTEVNFTVTFNIVGAGVKMGANRRGDDDD